MFPTQHIWVSEDLPPLKYARCMCGKLTWEEGVTLAYWEALEPERAGQEIKQPNLPGFLDYPQGFSGTPGV